ncbi:MAG: DUF3134 domain-containing protein [Symploca sp. SIO2C1]|nr:DUF3134 domain-containing protein [Symploca sp. SIO2C1]
MYNPSLREQPRDHQAEVIPLNQHTSLLNWLESQGRLLARESQDEMLIEGEEEISELMDVDDNGYDDDDEDGLDDE